MAIKVDDCIFGSSGYWYVVVGGAHAGYFHTLRAARKFARKQLQ